MTNEEKKQLADAYRHLNSYLDQARLSARQINTIVDPHRSGLGINPDWIRKELTGFRVPFEEGE